MQIRLILLATTLALSVLLPWMREYGEWNHESVVAKLASGEEFHAHKIIPDVNLYLGNYSSSLQFEHLKDRNITHILSVILAVASPPVDPRFRQNFNYLVVKGFDQPNQILIEHFNESHSFIDQGLKAGGVLIHCMAGASRSATVLLSYLMKNHDLSFEKALELARKARSVVAPNEGFVKQLQKYEKQLKDEKNSLLEAVQPPLSDYAAQEIHGWNPLTTIVLKCPKGEDCIYMKGSVAVDFAQSVFIYVQAQIFRTLRDIVSPEAYHKLKEFAGRFV